MLSRPLLIAAFALLIVQPARALVVGGFDASRGGIASIESGSFYATLRADILAAFPGAQITGSSVLDAAYLSSIDVLIIASAVDSVTAISPLTTAEQAALLAFVQNGSGAILITDNDTFAGLASDPANESLLDPFGLDATGTIISAATVTNPVAHPVTDGPFGLVASYNTIVAGWFDGLGPATALATLDGNGQPTLAVLDPGALGQGSGGVVFFSDTTFDNVLVLNAIAFTPVPVPALGPLGLGALGALIVAGAAAFRRRHRH